MRPTAKYLPQSETFVILTLDIFNFDPGRVFIADVENSPGTFRRPGCTDYDRDILRQKF